MTDTSSDAQRPHRAIRGTISLLDAFLANPISGMLPWIVMGLFTGPGKFEESAAAALGLSLMLTWLTYKRGGVIKSLELFDTLYFAIMAGLAIFASHSTISWLELWGGEMSNFALVAFAVCSMLIRHPFTLQYAAEQTEPEERGTPLYMHVNYVITGAWALAFATQTAAGLYGDAIQHDSNNFWTGWIFQLFPMFFALAFTEFYPDHAVATFQRNNDQPVDTDDPSWARLADWIPVFMLITGIMGLVTDSVTTWLGIALIVIGIIGARAMAMMFPQPKKAQSH